MTMAKLIAIVLLTCSANVWALSSSDKFETEFQTLKGLRIESLNMGTDNTAFARVRASYQAFIGGGDTAAEFLIAKLRQMNAEEAKYEKDLNDTGGGLKYLADQVIQNKDGVAKYDICFILAEIFPRASSPTQTEILAVLRQSYMPSSYGRDDMQFLHYSMWRIGAKAVPSLLDLAATHPSEFVRCGVSSGLNSMVEQNRTENSHLRSLPARLDCKAPQERRLRDIGDWSAWWANHEKDATVPAIPYILDARAERP
jgi:hypothetical protein